nr:transposase family protein [Serratia marcescens]
QLLEDKSARRQLQKRAFSYAYVGDNLYRRSYNGIWLKCPSPAEAKRIMEEVHIGTCGAHQSGPKMRLQIQHLGYYWPSMIKDCMDITKRCQQCQIHGNFIHQHPNPLHPTIASWPFEMWGTDVIGPIDPPSAKGHRFILAATDYFSRWTEAVALKEVKTEDILKFFREHILYRFGTPRRILSDNGPSFRSFKIGRFAKQHKFEWRYSSIYNPRANGLAETFNKTLVKLLKKVVTKNKRDWHLRLPEALWAYRISHRTPTKSTPFSLVYGTEAVLPVELEVPSLRIAIQNELTNEDRIRLRSEELDALDETRIAVQQKLELYRKTMARSYNKRGRLRTFTEGELVLVLRRPIHPNRHAGGKFQPNWEGPYAIEKVFDGGAYQLIDAQGTRPIPPINGRYLKKYFA